MGFGTDALSKTYVYKTHCSPYFCCTEMGEHWKPLDKCHAHTEHMQMIPPTDIPSAVGSRS